MCAHVWKKYMYTQKTTYINEGRSYGAFRILGAARDKMPTVQRLKLFADQEIENHLLQSIILLLFIRGSHSLTICINFVFLCTNILV